MITEDKVIETFCVMDEEHHRVYQRPAEEQGQHRTFKAQINIQFHHEHLLCIHGIFIL